jgi:hypothetical protein
MITAMARALKFGNRNQWDGLLLVLCLYYHLSGGKSNDFNHKSSSDNFLQKDLYN